jgi:nitroreductase
MVTVTDSEQLSLLRQTLSKGNYWALEAPVLTAFITHPDWSMRVGGRDLAFFELGMAAMAYQLQAVSEGLYVHPIVGFDAQKAKSVLGIDDDVVLEVMMVVGHPGDSAKLNEKHLQSETSDRQRKPIDQVAASSRWDERLVPTS